MKATLTKVGDPDGDVLIEYVENHDGDKADEGGRDRRGDLGCHVVFELLQVLVFEFRRECKEHSQAVDGDGNNGRQDQQNLKDKEHKGKDRNVCLNITRSFRSRAHTEQLLFYFYYIIITNV